MVFRLFFPLPAVQLHQCFSRTEVEKWWWANGAERMRSRTWSTQDLPAMFLCAFSWLPLHVKLVIFIFFTNRNMSNYWASVYYFNIWKYLIQLFLISSSAFWINYFNILCSNVEAVYQKCWANTSKILS